MMRISQIKAHTRKLARDFGLNYKKNWFRYMWISTREETLSEYIGDCPDPIYNKYGRTKEDKIKHIDKFLASKDFEKCLKRFGGSVASKKSTKEQLKQINKIPNKKIKEEMLKFYNKVNKKMGKADYIALLTRTKIKKHYEWQMKYGLRHEWIHILLDENKIQFQQIKKNLWPYDEGINEYLGAYLDDNLDKLEEFRDKEKYPMEKKNWIYAIKFRKLFEGKDTPEERRKALIDLKERLKSETTV